MELQKEITTTDPNTVSANALELAIKKKRNSLELYIVEKINKSRYLVATEKLRAK